MLNSPDLPEKPPVWALRPSPPESIASLAVASSSSTRMKSLVVVLATMLLASLSFSRIIAGISCVANTILKPSERPWAAMMAMPLTQ